jgi:hypothetical protein
MTSELAMWTFREQKKFIDLIIHIGDATYDCHKIVLASVPGYFSDLFSLDFQETVCDEITIRLPDPLNVFPGVLKYLYTKDLSFVTPENALSLHFQAIYFRLPELKQATEALFQRIDRRSGLHLLQQIAHVPLVFFPSQVVKFFAQSFHQFCTNPLFIELPPALLHQILGDGALRLLKERQFIDFLSEFNERHHFSRENLEKYRKLVQWKFLTEADWDVVNWQLLISAERKAQFLEIRRKKEGMGTTFANVLLALEAPDPRIGIASLQRYYPPVIDTFTFEDNFFENPRKFHVNEKLLNKKNTELVISMVGSASLYISAIKAVLPLKRNVDLLTIVSETITRGKTLERTFSPVNADGTAVFDFKLSDRVPLSVMTLRFTVQDVKKFAITSIAADGFICLT